MGRSATVWSPCTLCSHHSDQSVCNSRADHAAIETCRLPSDVIRDRVIALATALMLSTTLLVGHIRWAHLKHFVGVYSISLMACCALESSYHHEVQSQRFFVF